VAARPGVRKSLVEMAAFTCCLRIRRVIVRDQVMRHDPNLAVYNGSWINVRLLFDIQWMDVEAEVRRLTTAIGSAKSRRRNIISEEHRADYFCRRPTEDIDRQNSGFEVPDSTP
jgi:hypothetical protein